MNRLRQPSLAGGTARVSLPFTAAGFMGLGQLLRERTLRNSHLVVSMLCQVCLP